MWIHNAQLCIHKVIMRVEYSSTSSLCGRGHYHGDCGLDHHHSLCCCNYTRHHGGGVMPVASGSTRCNKQDDLRGERKEQRWYGHSLHRLPRVVHREGRVKWFARRDAERDS